MGRACDEPAPTTPSPSAWRWPTGGSPWAWRFALPALGGFFLDRRWGSRPALTLLGATLGFAAGMYHILRISRTGPRPDADDATKPGPTR